jgi:hypothetical protein
VSLTRSRRSVLSSESNSSSELKAGGGGVRCSGPCLYRSELGRWPRHAWHHHYFMRRGRRGPHATRGIIIYAAADYRSDASTPVLAEKTHRRWVTARRARRNVRHTQADTLRVRRDASEEHILARFASPRTVRSLCVASLEVVPDAFCGPTDGNGRSTSVYAAPLEMP